MEAVRTEKTKLNLFQVQIDYKKKDLEAALEIGIMEDLFDCCVVSHMRTHHSHSYCSLLYLFWSLLYSKKCY